MGERIEPGKGHLTYGREFVSYVYQPATTETTQGIVILPAGLGDEASEDDSGIPIFAANGFDTLKVAGPHGDGTPRLPNRKVAEIPERSVNAIWMAYDHVFLDREENQEHVPTIIYGPSMGGRTALLAARKRAEQVSAVVVSNPAYCPPGSHLIDRTRRYFGSGIESFRSGSAEFKRGSVATLKRLIAAPVASLRLGATALEQDLPEIVFELAEKNVKTVFILGQSDTVFDPNETSTRFLSHFHARYTEKVKDNLRPHGSLDHVIPGMQFTEGGHYLDNYAQLGLRGIQAALGKGNEQCQENGEVITLFDTSGKV